MAAGFATPRPAIARLAPLKKYNVRTVRGSLAGGNVHSASASSVTSQMASSASGFAAQESGGGVGGCASASAPATTVISTPGAGLWRGTSRSQNIVKYGAANLLLAGRFTQI